MRDGIWGIKESVRFWIFAGEGWRWFLPCGNSSKPHLVWQYYILLWLFCFIVSSMGLKSGPLLKSLLERLQVWMPRPHAQNLNYLVWNRAWHQCFVLLFSVSSGDSNMQAELRTTELELEDNDPKGVSLIPGRGDSSLLSSTLFFVHKLFGFYNIVCNRFEGVWPGQAYITRWPLINRETKTNILLLGYSLYWWGEGRETEERELFVACWRKAKYIRKYILW